MTEDYKLINGFDNYMVSNLGNVKNFKLLLKKKELTKLQSKLDKGLSIVPYKVFSNEKGLIKVEIVLARGKKIYDKRESLKNRDIEREISRTSGYLKI